MDVLKGKIYPKNFCHDQWLDIKANLHNILEGDQKLQDLAENHRGLKPQGAAVEVVGRIYTRYCEVFNKLCEYYDQLAQVQKRPYIRKIIDSVTCRILELKSTLEEVECFEYTYTDNALQSNHLVPQDMQVQCPPFYSHETRAKDMQYIMDEIKAGNRLGDPSPTASQLENVEEIEPVEEEQKRRLSDDEAQLVKQPSVVLTPEELEQLRLTEEYNGHLLNIQRMDRSRRTLSKLIKIANKEIKLYLEASGTKAPTPPLELRIRAAKIIQLAYRCYMKAKREKIREDKVKIKLGMIFPSWSSSPAKEQWESMKTQRRAIRENYYAKWLECSNKIKSHVKYYHEGDIKDNIAAEIKQWLQEWYTEVRIFDEFPYALEGGSILITRGETLTVEEYIEWRIEEDKRLKQLKSNPKTKEDIKAEIAAAKEEEQRKAQEAKDREKKIIEEYKKSRMNPDTDPGIYVNVSKNIESVQNAWFRYNHDWKDIESNDVPEGNLYGYLEELITENIYKDFELEFRPLVDDIMRLELVELNKAVKKDFQRAGVTKIPQSQKRKRPPPIPQPKPEKWPPAFMFQDLYDNGIIVKYPVTYLDDYLGEQNYASAELRAVPWTPSFSPPSLGDVREMIRIRCILTLCSSCSKTPRAQLIVGPKNYGKRLIVDAIATETNSVLIDLSPKNIYNKYPGPRKLKLMLQYVNRIARLMQPTIILIEDVDKVFYKTVPKQDKWFLPTRLQKFVKDLCKSISSEDKVLVIGTASEPWLAKKPLLKGSFSSIILLPRIDYSSIAYILSRLLMKYHKVDREFNYSTVAQMIRGYDINAIKKGIETLMNAERIIGLAYQPLAPEEVVNAITTHEEAVQITEFDYERYKTWYKSISPWGEKSDYYMTMIDTQLKLKLKKEKQNE